MIDKTLCYKNSHTLFMALCWNYSYTFSFLGYCYNNWHFLLFFYWLIDRTLCHTKFKMCHILSFSKISLGGGSGETCVTWNRLRDFFFVRERICFVSLRVFSRDLSVMRGSDLHFCGQIKDLVLIAGALKIDLWVDVDIKLPLWFAPVPNGNACYAG